MQTPTQTQNLSPEKGQTQGTQGKTQIHVYGDLVAVVKKYVKLRYNDLKELGDLSLTIENFIEVIKKTMGQMWYDAHVDMTLDDVLHDLKHDDVIDFVLDLRNWGLENLTFMELETICTIINDIIDYCMKRGYGPDDSIDDCFMTGDDA
jgi:hypothetical protein